MIGKYTLRGSKDRLLEPQGVTLTLTHELHEEYTDPKKDNPNYS